MVAAQLRLDLLVAVVKDQMIAAPICVIALARHQFAAAQARQRSLVRQTPRRKIAPVWHAAGHNWPVGIAVKPLHDDFHAGARYRHGAKARAGPAARHPDPRRAVLIVLAFTIPME